jgi:hypothetical protein
LLHRPINQNQQAIQTQSTAQKSIRKKNAYEGTVPDKRFDHHQKVESIHVQKLKNFLKAQAL